MVKNSLINLDHVVRPVLRSVARCLSRGVYHEVFVTRCLSRGVCHKVSVSRVFVTRCLSRGVCHEVSVTRCLSQGVCLESICQPVRHVSSP